jgi:hypothetical protein
MWFDSLLDLFPRARHANRPRGYRSTADRRRARKLFLEGLEDRHLLAFNMLTEYATDLWPRDLHLVDVNGDTRADMIVDGSSLGVRLGNADGTFGPIQTSATGYLNSVAATGDFTGDGLVDVVTAGYPGLNLRAGNGDGTFQAPQLVSLPPQHETDFRGYVGLYGQFPNSVASGDLNADGKLDLVVGGSTRFRSGIVCGYYGGCGYSYSGRGYINVLIGNGAGSFNYADADPSSADLNAHLLSAAALAAALAVNDLNHDGKPDVVVSTGGVAALLGDGTGALQSPIRSAGGSPLPSISLGDVDGDGNLDALQSSENSLVVLKGQGDGSFVQGAVVNTGQRLQSAVMGDVNADGKLDLVAVGTAPCQEYGYFGGCYDPTTTKQANVLLGNGQGSFSLPITSPLATVNDLYSNLNDVVLADLTGDGLPDLVTIDSRPGAVAIVAANDGQWLAPEELTISDATIVEGDSGSISAVFTVTLTGHSGGPVSVDFATADNDAYYWWGPKAGVDYSPQSGTLTFGPDVLSRTITVPVLGDRLGEGDETFYVNLSNPIGALLRKAQAAGTIVDNEPRISIDHPYGVVEGDVGTTPAVFTVTLSRPYDQEVTVHYYTLTGHVNDIVSANATLHFAPGETSKPITVQVVGDLLYEYYEEAFNVYLDNASPNATIADSAAYCVIVDNDPPPTVSIGDVSKNEGSIGTTKFNFTLKLSAPSDGAFVEFTTANGTATTSNQDYTAKSGYVSFSAGQTTQTISIDVKGDKTSEANETFFVNIVSAGFATIADGQGIGTIVNDDGVAPPPQPTISIGDASVVEGNSGSRNMTFTVNLSAASNQTVRVNYATANGTARTSDNDYVSNSGTVTFSPGQTNKTITVAIKGDKKQESNEQFFVNLSGASGAQIDDGQGLGTILNDDSGAAAIRNVSSGRMRRGR